MGRLDRGRADGTTGADGWRVLGESLVAAAFHLRRLNPTNRAEQSAAHIPAPASLSLPVYSCLIVSPRKMQQV